MPEANAKVVPGPRLDSLIRACEKSCASDCCGIDAFDFSPLHIASHLSSFTGIISDDDLTKLEVEIASLVAQSGENTPDADGFICCIDGMNQYFTRDELDALANRMRTSIRLAPQVLEFARSLEVQDMSESLD